MNDVRTLRIVLAVTLFCSVVGCGGSDTHPDGGVSDLGASDAPAGDAPLVDMHAGADAGCPDEDSDGHRAIACGGDDCDDSDPDAYPGNRERCDTLGHDEDCDPTTLGPDGEPDGFVSNACCELQPGGALVCGTDCDDMRATVNPAAVETCNGIDDDCNGTTDDGDVLLVFFYDVDGDGYGDSSVSMMACTAPLGYVLTGGDCDDVHNSVHPGAPDGPVVNCNGVDDDCDGTADPGCPCLDGHTQMCGAVDSTGHLLTTAPCHPGTQTCVAAAWGPCVGAVLPAPETCNMMDDNCNGLVDDGATIPCYADGDSDGYAIMGTASMLVCADSAGHCPGATTSRTPGSASSSDCNDSQATVHPGALEACNAVDDDCNGLVDDTAGTVQWVDADGDGYGAGAMVRACVLMTGYATRNGDCDDADATVHPGAAQRCDDTSDGDCDGEIGYMDRDADTWCTARPNTMIDNPSWPITCTGLGLGYPTRCTNLRCAVDSMGTPYGDCNDSLYMSASDADGCETPLRTDTDCYGCHDTGRGDGRDSCSTEPGGTFGDTPFTCTRCGGSSGPGSGYECVSRYHACTFG